jgi:hypothetical protein
MHALLLQSLTRVLHYLRNAVSEGHTQKLTMKCRKYPFAGLGGALDPSDVNCS